MAESHKQHGDRLVRLKKQQTFEGEVKGIVELRSGKYLHVVDGQDSKRKKHLYVPCQKDAIRYVGKDVRVSLHTRRTQTFRIEHAPKRQQKLF